MYINMREGEVVEVVEGGGLGERELIDGVVVGWRIRGK